MEDQEIGNEKAEQQREEPGEDSEFHRLEIQIERQADDVKIRHNSTA